ncbi:MAG TPA: non-homologous end-joining DNA ligase [Propionibacteriaceae bacterium]|nr:non-homologous end-joining DNA ligase [Propionibacteriaceae bacterium]
MVGSAEVRTAVAGRTLTLTNLDKVLFPAVGYTKAEVIAYYAAIADTLLPHVCDRALTRIRYPDGVGPSSSANDRSFYEKNAPKGTPDWVRTAPVLTSDGLVDYVVAEEPATVVWLANLAALEMHVPQWTISSATPDAEGVIHLPGADPQPGEPLANRVVVDLDPGAGMTLVECSRAALMVAALLAADDMIPVPQTSGSKGMQVYAAVQPCRSADATAYVRQLARRLKKSQPDLFVLTMSVAQRAGHIYVDHLQNIAAKNTVSPYSLRGREQPGVATPLSWDEVAAVTAPEELKFTPEQVLERVAEHGDFAADLLGEHAPPLPTLDQEIRA